MATDPQPSTLKRIPDGRSVNDIVDQMNEVITEWDDTVGPCNDLKAKCMQIAKLDKTPGTNMTHMFQGLMIAAIADCNMSADQVQKEIKWLDKKPYVKLGNFQKYADLAQTFPDLVEAYFNVIPNIESIANKIKPIPEHATECLKNLPQEFEDLDFMERVKIVKEITNLVSKIKDKCEAIADDMRGFKSDCEEIQETFNKIKDEISTGNLEAKGQKARGAKKSGIKDCYEFTYGKIVAPGKSG
jgi:septation ring formation regulator EzrA